MAKKARSEENQKAYAEFSVKANQELAEWRKENLNCSKEEKEARLEAYRESFRQHCENTPRRVYNRLIASEK